MWSYMAERKYPRIEIYQRTYDLLRLEEIFSKGQKNMKDIVADSIERTISDYAKRSLDFVTEDQATTRPKDIRTIDQQTTKSIDKEPSSQEIHLSKIHLSKNPAAQAAVLKLHGKGLSNTQIGKQLGYPESTVRRFLKRKA
jgi:DNA-binding NarL/FixJ family response regulator